MTVQLRVIPPFHHLLQFGEDASLEFDGFPTRAFHSYEAVRPACKRAMHTMGCNDRFPVSCSVGRTGATRSGVLLLFTGCRRAHDPTGECNLAGIPYAALLAVPGSITEQNFYMCARYAHLTMHPTAACSLL